MGGAFEDRVKEMQEEYMARLESLKYDYFDRTDNF
jgi:hypothetical protein